MISGVLVNVQQPLLGGGDLTLAAVNFPDVFISYVVLPPQFSSSVFSEIGAFRLLLEKLVMIEMIKTMYLLLLIRLFYNDAYKKVLENLCNTVT